MPSFMPFSVDNALNRYCPKVYNFGPGGIHPLEFTGAYDELTACRKTAWFGTALSASGACLDVYGPDAIKLMNYVCVNRDFGQLQLGRSRHAILCNSKGQMLADGLVIRTGEDRFRTYYLTPVIDFYIDTLGWNVKCAAVTDEFFYQLDGPKSLEILEAATRTDLHSMKFAGRMNAVIRGKAVTIIRLGMSGSLAYEIHGAFQDSDDVYDGILEAGQAFGIRRLGGEQYSENHTTGGYPNQAIHFAYPYLTSGEEMKKYLQKRIFFFMTPDLEHYAFQGSASDEPESYFVTPYDIKWDYIINYDHDFVGKEALLQIAKNPPKTVVTLEWNLDDVGAAYAAEIADKDYILYDDITQKCFNAGCTSKVLLDGEKIGITSGKVRDYYHGAIISLGIIRRDAATEGKEIQILWGSNGKTQRLIRATVARFPYYNGEYRNETFDVEKIPHPQFKEA